MCKRKTKEEFIEDAIKVHGDKYDYSLVEYVNSITKIKIICSKHGQFTQSPNKHIFGRGCRLCANENSSKNKRDTTEKFIEKAREVHGEKYDYSKVNYIKSTQDVIIICPIHGESKQRPANHLANGGCLGCGRDKMNFLKTRSKEKFVKKCRETHGDIYDYTITNYKNCKDVIEITCSKHGNFEQIADNHQRGATCPSCSKEKITDKQGLIFIKKANKLHNNKYDYSLVDYLNNKEKLKIICPIHGLYEQSALNHLQGNGCTKCGREKRETLKYTTEEFIKKSINTHENRYDYSLSEYINCKTNVKIICNLHGVFEQNPTRHIRGAGCNKCSVEKKSKNYRHTKEQFVEKAKKLHGDTYKYDLVEYVQSKIKVKIICMSHGVFEQTPCHHLLNKGCPKCGNLMNVYKKEDYMKISEKAKLYIIRCWKDNESFYKIGKTKDSVKSRFSNTNIKPYKYEIINIHEGNSGDIFDLEIELHKKYYAYKQKPLHKFAGHTECYNLNLPIEEIKLLHL